AGFIWSKVDFIKLIAIPMITTNCAKIIPLTSNTTRKKCVSKKVPTGVLKKISNIAPNAIGETITGRYNNALTKFFNGKLYLDKTYPIGIAKIVAMSDDIVAVIKVNRIENKILEILVLVFTN
ncbi:MAG: hypothetical protein SNJ64_06610, partial [Endomicrobiia bacterium]